MKLVDSHCHLNHPLLACRVDQVISNARNTGVSGFIIPGVTAAQWPEILGLSSLFPNCFAAVGLHPLFLNEHRQQDIHQLEELCKGNEIIAVGEIGLDFYQGREQQKEQQLLLEIQLRVAQKFDLPVILHVRKAHDEVLATLRRLQFTRGGSVHAFNGSYQQATQYIDMGFVIGVGGALTYDRARKIRNTVSKLPLSSLILETDSPDMVMAGLKGPNRPEYLPVVLRILAKMLGLPQKSIAEACLENTLKVFRIALS